MQQTETYLRLATILGDKKADPPIEPIIPVSKQTWYNNVKKGLYPQPIKISERVTLYKASEIYNLRDFGTVNTQK
jgi:hypothetical protein